MPEIKDYYAVLGLDLEASAETIKAAYRRLARENHPDRIGNLDPVALAAAQKRMAELNEAYAVLSDSKQRREYDSKWRSTFSQRPEDLDAAMEAIKEEQQKAVDVQAARAKARQRAETIASMARQFSVQVRRDLTNNQQDFKWKETNVDGFEWGLESSFLLAKYVVAMRAFPIADQAAARKFTNYASFAYPPHQSRLKANFFLFVMAFQRLADSEAVVAECKRFASAGAPPSALGTQSLVVLLDANQGRNIVCGPDPTDKRFRQLVNNIRVRRT